MADDNIKRIPIKDLISEDGVDELLESPEMEPYVKLAVVAMQGSDVTAELESLRQLPLQERYVWRVASALKWAFADCETANVKADKETLSAQDLAKVLAMLRVRPMQFCLFLKTLVGAEEMQRMMVEAIKVATRVP
ncbi:MAG: hypothetical protein ABSH49_36795 [Bryobacteraceae bacterium]|jgi:hypothetical protein